MDQGGIDPGMPMGLSMALAQNIRAMQHFSGLPRDQQRRIIDHTRNIQSKEEMRAYVNGWLE